MFPLLVGLDDAGSDHASEDLEHGLFGSVGQCPPALDRFEGVLMNAQPQLGGRGYPEPSQKAHLPLFVGAYRVGRAYLRVLGPDVDRRAGFSAPTSPRRCRTPSTVSTVERASVTVSPKRSVAETATVPGDPSGSMTTKKRLPLQRLNDLACRTSPNSG